MVLGLHFGSSIRGLVSAVRQRRDNARVYMLGIGVQILLVSIGLYKLQSLGLIPNRKSDFLAFEKQSFIHEELI